MKRRAGMRGQSPGQSMVEAGLVMGLIAVLAVATLLYWGPFLKQVFSVRSTGGSGAQNRIQFVTHH